MSEEGDKNEKVIENNEKAEEKTSEKKQKENEKIEERSPKRKEKSRKRKKNPNKKEEKISKKQKLEQQKGPNVRDFFEGEAEERDNESAESIISDADDFAIDEADEVEKLEAENKLLPQRTAPIPDFMNTGDNPEEIEQKISKYNIIPLEDLQIEGTSELFQQGCLPTMKDPKIFAVRCKLGQEKEAVTSLLNKFLHFKGSDAELLFCSASFIEKFPGQVQIEAEKEVHVRNAIKDLKAFNFGSIPKINIIPIKEVPLIQTSDHVKNVDVILMYFQLKQLKPGQWVRIKSGPYKGDLAKVRDFNETKQRVQVKIVPRIGDRKEGKEDEKINPLKVYQQTKLNKLQSERNKRLERAPQKLFEPDSHQECHVERNLVTHEKIFFSNGQSYVNGFLLKKFSVKNIQFKDVLPLLEELDLFLKGESSEEDKENLFQETLKDIEKTKLNLNKFQKGDQVIVVEGDLKNLIGVVINSTQNEVSIFPQNETLANQDPISFLPRELIKQFQQGDHVQISEGKYAAQTGTIISVDNNNRIATLIFDNINVRQQAFTNDLQKAHRVSDNPTKIALYQELKKQDLIKLLKSDEAGIVLKVDPDNVQIIDNEGNCKTITQMLIDQIIREEKKGVLNHYKQIISINSTVKVLDGAFKGKTGTVKKLQKDVAFLYNTEMQNTYFIFAEKVNNIALLTLDTKATMEQKPNKSYLKKKCIVAKGPDKGLIGIGIDENEKNVRLELLARPRKVWYPREMIYVENEFEEPPEMHKEDIEKLGKTPMHPGQFGFQPNTPYPQSPGYGMPSPGYGLSAQSPGPNTMQPEHQNY